MPDLNYVGRNLVTRNADGSFGQDLEENIVGVQNIPFRLTASQVGNADLTEVDLLPALGSEAFYMIHGLVAYPVANGGTLAASGTLELIYGGTAQKASGSEDIAASGDNVMMSSAPVLVYDSSSFPLSDVKNKTIAVKSATPIDIPGVIFASSVGAGGAGYAVNDLFNIISTIDASVIGTGRVTSVAAGVVDGYVILTSTLGATRAAHATAKTSGGGDDNFTIDVLALDYSSNPALIVGKLFYSTHSAVV